MKIVRIRRGEDWYLGPDARGKPQFGRVKKEDARICLSRESAEALIKISGIDDASVDVEDIE